MKTTGNENNQSDQKTMNAVMKRYIEICNEAIEKNNSLFPGAQFHIMGRTITEKNPILLAVYDDRPKGAYSLLVSDKQLALGNTPTELEKAWRLKLSHIEDVLSNPAEYIDQPNKLDLEWLKIRIGM